MRIVRSPLWASSSMFNLSGLVAWSGLFGFVVRSALTSPARMILSRSAWVLPQFGGSSPHRGTLIGKPSQGIDFRLLLGVPGRVLLLGWRSVLLMPYSVHCTPTIVGKAS